MIDRMIRLLLIVLRPKLELFGVPYTLKSQSIKKPSKEKQETISQSKQEETVVAEHPFLEDTIVALQGLGWDKGKAKKLAHAATVQDGDHSLDLNGLIKIALKLGDKR